MQTYGKVDSKFRFVILASKRAKQILRGSKVRVKSKSRNPIRLAQIEVKEGLVDYEILQSRKEDIAEAEEQVLSVDVGIVDVEEAEGDPAEGENLGEDGGPEEDVEAGDEDEFSGEVLEEEKEDS